MTDAQSSREVLTNEQAAARDELVGIGFSQEEAERFVQAKLPFSEIAWECLRAEMRKMGISESQIEAEVVRFDNSIDEVLARHGAISPPSQTKQ